MNHLQSAAFGLGAGLALLLLSQAASAQEGTEVPAVRLTVQEKEFVRVDVGDVMPSIELPKLGEQGTTRLTDLYGDKATVVVFWSGDRRMARQQLVDLGPDIIKPFGEAGVAVVGIAVGEDAQAVESVLQQTGATLPTLLDVEGRAFEQVGSAKLPRTYVLDEEGRILWFDIEYSLATRRELNRILHSLTGTDPPQSAP